MALIGIAIISFLSYFIFTKPASAPKKTRIAIMPFQPDNEANAFVGNDIALQLVETLTNQYQDRFDIIGPTTTSTIDPQKIWGFADDYQIDYFINGRFSKKEGESRMLAEFIRSSDGAHVWVESFDASAERGAVPLEIQKGVIGYLMAAKER